MGLSISAYRYPKSVTKFDYDFEKEHEEKWFHDEKLYSLIDLVGEKEGESYFFDKDKILLFLYKAKQIFDGNFEGEVPDYALKYSNENEKQFYIRWAHVISFFEIFRVMLDWEKEHIVIFVSC